ncbi:MAG: class I SAM-dependent methyltransferase [Bacteroidota bacterium]
MHTSSWRWRLAQFTELHWWKRYLSSQDEESYLNKKRAYWQRVLDQLMFEPTKGERVLEVGCGPAGIFILLNSQQRMTAMDPLIEEYESNLTHFDRSMYPEVSFHVGMMESFQPDEKYSTIYAFNTINHVSNWKTALNNLNNLLKPGGTLIISSDVHRFSLLRTIFHLLPGDVLHPQQHSRHHYMEAFRQYNWNVIEEAKLKREAIFDYYAWVLTKN